MSHRLKNLNQKYYIALGISIAFIFLIIDFIPEIYHFNPYSLLSPFSFIRYAGAIVALFLLIVALAKIISKTFTPYVNKTIIILLIGAIIATSITLIYFDFFKIIVIVVCVVVIGYTLTYKKREEARPQEEISPQHKIAQREYNMPMILFAVGGILIVIGIVGAINGLLGIGGLGVDIEHLFNFPGYILLGFLVGIPFIVFIVPGYFIVRLAYRKYSLSKQ